MTRGLILMGGIGLTAKAAGIALLLRPAAVRRLFGIADRAEAIYALRIAGMMLTALGLFLTGFALAAHFAGAAV